MNKKYAKIVIICFAIFSIVEGIKTKITNNEVRYYFGTIFNIVLCGVLIISFTYLYKKYEKNKGN